MWALSLPAKGLQEKLLIELGGMLSATEYRIVSYLWDSGSATFDDLGRDCWDTPIQPASQKTTIKRLSKRLVDINRGVSIATKNEIVTLDRPDK